MSPENYKTWMQTLARLNNQFQALQAHAEKYKTDNPELQILALQAHHCVQELIGPMVSRSFSRFDVLPCESAVSQKVAIVHMSVENFEIAHKDLSVVVRFATALATARTAHRVLADLVASQENA